MPYYADTDDVRARDLRLVGRIHRMRVAGAVLSALPVASVLFERAAPAGYWLMFAANVLVWPIVSYAVSRRARDPVRTEFHCLVADSAFGGAWIAAMAVSVVPAAVFATLLTADKIAAGGWPLLRRAAPAMLAGFGLTWAAVGFPFEPGSSPRTVLATIPFLFAYTVALSALTAELGRRVVHQNRELARLSRIDPIVQLPNRPHFEDRVRAEIQRCRRTGRPACLLLADIDLFKTINDQRGHAAGDEVLKQIARLLRENVREIDTPARYGGDEFALLLTETAAQDGAVVAERIRAQAEALSFESAADLRCTLSIGLAEYSAGYASLDQWIRAADAALYRAKAAGRNHVAAA